MQGAQAVVGILELLLFVVVWIVLSVGSMLLLTAGVGLVGGVLSVPLLYLLPDVRRFLVQASGGRPDDGTPTWRVVFRPGYLALSAAFGIGYGLVFTALLVPVIRLGLFPGTGEPKAGLVVVPVVFTVASALVAYGLQRLSNTWPAGVSRRAVFAQWVAFLGVVVTVGSTVTLVVIS